jgi:hypothetical protein
MESHLAAPLAAAADNKAGADSSHEAGREIEEVLTGQGSASVAEDLPPAGPASELTDAQLDWLHANLVEGAQPIMAEPFFQAFVRNDDEVVMQFLLYLKVNPKIMPDTLFLIYKSLGSVVDSEGLSGSERAVLAQALNNRFVAVLDAMSRSQVLNKSQRDVSAEVCNRFLRNHAVLNEFIHHRQAARIFGALRKSARALVAPSEQQTYAADRWIIDPPIPSEQRGLEADREEFNHSSKTAEMEDIVKRWQFDLEKYLSRYRIVMQNPRFSQSFRDKMTQELSAALGRFFQKELYVYHGLERVSSSSLHKSFLDPWALTARAHRAAWVPDNANLRLVPEPGGYRVEADFETNIQDDAVLKTVKASIEEYWRGHFEDNGRDYSFRVVVSIKKLAPDQAFLAGSLRLMDSLSAVSNASPDTIVLDHRLGYGVPAHEFGHIMGLNDEYREGYDPDLAAAVHLQNRASLMGNSQEGGKVLPRHFKTAYQLLRRHSLRP